MNEETDPRSKHWLGVPKWKKATKKKQNRIGNFLGNIWKSIKKAWELDNK